MSQVLKQAIENGDQFMLDVLGGGTTVMEEVKRFGIPEACNNAKTLCKATALYKTVDGCGLRSFSNAIGPSEWLTDGVDRMVSDQWLKSVKVRATVLENRLRKSRYKPFIDTICSAKLMSHRATSYNAVAVLMALIVSDITL